MYWTSNLCDRFASLNIPRRYSSMINRGRLQWRYMSVMASPITGKLYCCSVACSGQLRRKQQSFALIDLKQNATKAENVSVPLDDFEKWWPSLFSRYSLNSSPHEQNGCHFGNYISIYFFVNGTFCISINISRNFFPQGPINNIPRLVRMMAWRRIADKPLSEPILTQFTDACIYAALGEDKF